MWLHFLDDHVDESVGAVEACSDFPVVVPVHDDSFLGLNWMLEVVLFEDEWRGERFWWRKGLDELREFHCFDFVAVLF